MRAPTALAQVRSAERGRGGPCVAMRGCSSLRAPVSRSGCGQLHAGPDLACAAQPSVTRRQGWHESGMNQPCVYLWVLYQQKSCIRWHISASSCQPEICRQNLSTPVLKRLEHRGCPSAGHLLDACRRASATSRPHIIRSYTVSGMLARTEALQRVRVRRGDHGKMPGAPEAMRARQLQNELPCRTHAHWAACLPPTPTAAGPPLPHRVPGTSPAPLRPARTPPSRMCARLLRPASGGPMPVLPPNSYACCPTLFPMQTDQAVHVLRRRD